MKLINKKKLEAGLSATSPNKVNTVTLLTQIALFCSATLHTPIPLYEILEKDKLLPSELNNVRR